MTQFRIRWLSKGGHVHTRMFALNQGGATYELLGAMVFRPDEWEAFLSCFRDHGEDKVTVVPEDGMP